ncbi:MAG: hypothetical protein JEZ03_09625 [Bacteroidales bacterium]|nr:hypothetical protein [Bacteroidales bacterium]
MKNIRTSITVILFFSLITSGLFCSAQDMPPPPPIDHNVSGNQPAGGAAPIGGGLGILLALAGVYGIKKTYGFLNGRRESSS